MKECPKCHTMIEDDAAFCGVCGTKQEIEEVEAQAEEQSSQEEQFCVHCGKSIEAGSLFCPYCGEPQDVEETKSEEPQPKVEEPAPELEESKVEESPKEEKRKLHTTSEKHEKQIDENALEKSILSMIKAHIKRFQEEEGKTIKSILKPKSYPNADIQLFSDANRQSILKVGINESLEGEKELYERLKDSKYFKLFVKDDSNSNEESFILDFHNDEEQAKNTILEILMTVYKQPKECAIGYVTNVSGYTMQEKGIEKSEKSSGCGCLIWILLVLLIAGGAGWYFYMYDSSAKAVEEKVAIDSIMSSPVVDVNAPTSALAFLDQFYKGEYENEDYIKKHATANVVNKLKRDCDYSDDCLATWVFSAFPAGADLNLEEGPIIRETEEEGKFRVVFVYSGYGENKPYYRNTVYLTVTEMDGKYMISDYEVEIAEEKEGILSFEDALRVAEEMVIKNDEFKGFRSPENVKNIMANNGYKYAGKYYVDREFLFDVLFYKDCLLGKSTGDGCYSNVPQAGGSGTPSFMGIDNGQLYLAPFNKTAFDVFLNQAKEFGATMKENNESSISYKYLNFEITGFKNGVKSIKYCIIITKEEEID